MMLLEIKNEEQLVTKLWLEKEMDGNITILASKGEMANKIGSFNSANGCLMLFPGIYSCLGFTRDAKGHIKVDLL